MRQSQLGWWVEKGYDATTAEIKYKDHQARAGLARSGIRGPGSTQEYGVIAVHL